MKGIEGIDDNIIRLFDGKKDIQDNIVRNHILLVTCGVVIGFALAFLIMNIILKRYNVLEFLNKTDAVFLDVNGKEQYCIQRPKMVHDLILSLGAIMYLKITGKDVCITSKLIKWLVFIVEVIVLIMVLCSIIYLTNNILI